MISIVVGSNTEITGKQIAYMQDKIENNEIKSNDLKLYYLGEENFSKITEKEFLHNLIPSDILIISGGETAYSLLDMSGFHYLLSGKQIMPLISTGIIKGGLFDSKKYVIKGGSIGNIDVYETIIKYARDNFHLPQADS